MAAIRSFEWRALSGRLKKRPFASERTCLLNAFPQEFFGNFGGG